MERTQVLEAMGKLKLYGMRAAYDEVLATAVKRQHEPQRVIGDLLQAEISESEPLMRHWFEHNGERAIDQVSDDGGQAATGQGDRGVPVRGHPDQRDPGPRSRRRRLPRAAAQPRADPLPGRALRRYVPRGGGTGTGKTHLAVGIARACIRSDRRGRFFNVVDLVNKLDAEARADRQGRTADILSRLDFVPRGNGPLDRFRNRSTPRRARLSPLRPDRRPTRSSGKRPTGAFPDPPPSTSSAGSTNAPRSS